MEFWIIHAQEPIADPRSVESRRLWRSNMIAETLADRGHEVVRWRSAFNHYRKTFLNPGSGSATVDGYEMQFIATSSYRRHVGARRVISHRALGRNFDHLARARPTAPDLIHVGNVPIELFRAAVAFGRERGVPVIVDVRDLWPDIYL